MGLFKHGPNYLKGLVEEVFIDSSKISPEYKNA